ncbi:MAG TPA: ABC transporter permease, partial [Rhabdaerophilum sp.]|nr:ABC transporter permease [Rhabdaerophilum sp.]
MLGYCLKRLGTAFLVALFVSILSFVLLRMSGDIAIAIAGEGAQSADIELVRKTYGLDRPLIVQYLDWLGQAARGNF